MLLLGKARRAGVALGLSDRRRIGKDASVDYDVGIVAIGEDLEAGCRFTATSAVTVSGLSVVDTGSDFTLFGQVAILGMIQLRAFGTVGVRRGVTGELDTAGPIVIMFVGLSG
jgi:hypothetical protein